MSVIEFSFPRFGIRAENHPLRSARVPKYKSSSDSHVAGIIHNSLATPTETSSKIHFIMMYFSIIVSATILLGIAFAAPVDMELRQELHPMALGVSRISSLLSFPLMVFILQVTLDLQSFIRIQFIFSFPLTITGLHYHRHKLGK
jgi:hypothetical protein